jgi:hypothetical protein
MRRDLEAAQAIRAAFIELQAGRFAAARDAAAPWTELAAASLLHALGRAGAGEVGSAAADLAAIAEKNPGARHPALDLADLLRRLGKPSEPHLRAALQHRPNDPALHGALGTVLAETGSAEAAVTAFHRAAELAPADAASWSNLGKALAATGRFEAAEAAFAKAGVLAPGRPQLTLNHAVARLKSGRLAEGWPLFRARHALPGRAPSPPGPELRTLLGAEGRTVLLVHDEGFGDTLQFLRYAPLLAAHGMRVRAAVPPALARLLRGSGIDVADGPTTYDAWVRIPDLPGLFETTAGSIPPPLRLTPGAQLVQEWGERLAFDGSVPGRRIGLVWTGAARSHDPAAASTDRIRSIGVGQLGPLLDPTKGVRWISLQHGQPAPAGLFDPMPEVADFADTAAIIANLDLVVSVDTAVAHLAASLGRPVLLLDRYDNCWRWLSGRADSPWYPETLKILRQPSPGDWTSVLRQAAAEVLRG